MKKNKHMAEACQGVLIIALIHVGEDGTNGDALSAGDALRSKYSSSTPRLPPPLPSNMLVFHPSSIPPCFQWCYI